MIYYSNVNANHSYAVSLMKCCPTSYLISIQLTLGTLRIIHYINITWVSCHYNDIIMSAMASQITLKLFTQPFIQAKIKENIKETSLALVRGIHWWLGISPHKGQLHWKCFHFMTSSCVRFFNSLLWLTTRSYPKLHITGPLWRDSTGFWNEVQVTIFIIWYL